MILELSIFDQNFTLECDAASEQSLRATAKLLDQKLREAKQAAPRVSGERIAILTALELLQQNLNLTEKMEGIDVNACAALIHSIIQRSQETITTVTPSQHASLV